MKTRALYLALLFFAMVATSCSQNKGDSAETSEAAEVETVVSGSDYTVDVSNSIIRWEGFKPAYSHYGTINLKGGNLVVEDGELVGGEFTIDMNTITDLDLEDPGKRANLVGHLKGTNEGQEDDFFNVPKYPTSKFVITKVTALEGDPNANHMIYGNLTMRDVTKQIGFKADVDITNKMVKATTPRFNIDRTKWNVKHLSGDFFDLAADKIIANDVALEIDLAATAK